ncbi:MAG: hypothetical protein UHS52_05435 [Alistipes sp.]|nr:hypothetical protein [Alistipes sp.]
MRKLFVSLAALAAIVGCSKVEEHNTNVDSKQTISLSASIELDDTRVAVVGEKFTEVSWEIDDAIRLVSQGGVNADLKATTAGRENVIFCGDGEFKAAVDTYYAVHPATDIVDAKVAFDYAQQSGGDFVSLVAKGEGRESNDLQLSFKPVNSLLHVAVSGVESLAKAEFKSFDGSDIASSFSYDFSTEETSMGGSTKAYVVENPAVDGFFFSLPANLDMINGYIVTLTDGAGNVCSKAYNGKVFERGTTTRVAIEWSQPTVTLATPMTSYSYYAAGDSATANNCANNVIYFNGASTFDNVQKAMVVEAGYIVDGQTYAATLDAANKSFSIGNVTVSSWGSKSVEAYIKTKDGRTFKSAAQTVHITGLPYHADWRSSNYSDWKLVSISYSSNRLKVSNGALGCIISPEFKVPSGSIRLNSAIAASTSATSAGGYTSSYAYVGTRNSSSKESGAVASVPSHIGSPHQPNTPLQQHNSVLELTSSNPCVVMTAKDFPMFCDTYVYQAKITYAQ